MSEESNRRTKGSHGNTKNKKRGKTRGGGKAPNWKDRLEQSKKDKGK